MLFSIDFNTETANNTICPNNSRKTIISATHFVIVADGKNAAFVIQNAICNHCETATDTIVGGTLLFDDVVFPVFIVFLFVAELETAYRGRFFDVGQLVYSGVVW